MTGQDTRAFGKGSGVGAIGSGRAVLAAVLAAVALALTRQRPAAGQPPSGAPAQWAAFVYLGVISMFLGFFAWYHGLAIGPMAQVSQVQLIQPVLSICWAGLLLGEHLAWSTIIGGLAVVLCAGLAVRARPSPTPSNTPRRAEPAVPAR